MLAHGEILPVDWQVDGTTGYDFMNEVSALQHSPDGEQLLTNFGTKLAEDLAEFSIEEQLARRQIVERSFYRHSWDALVSILYDLAGSDLKTRDYSASAIRRCLTEILATSRFIAFMRALAARHNLIKNIWAKRSIVRSPVAYRTVGWYLYSAMALRRRISADLDIIQNAALARFQQLSAPLCAKAVRNTAFYRYGRLISRNDVGFDANLFSLPTADFHRLMQKRADDLDGSMLAATATHDHKRGEDHASPIGGTQRDRGGLGRGSRSLDRSHQPGSYFERRWPDAGRG